MSSSDPEQVLSCRFGSAVFQSLFGTISEAGRILTLLHAPTQEQIRAFIGIFRELFKRLAEIIKIGVEANWLESSLRLQLPEHG